MTTVYAVVGQHRTVPGLLLLRGDDDRYYAYAAGRPSPVEPTAAWALDVDRQPDTDMTSVDSAPASANLLPERTAPQPTFRHALVQRGVRSVRTLAVALAVILAVVLGTSAALAKAPALVTTTADLALLGAPSAEASILAVLPAGTELELTGAANGEFLEVSSADQLGWAAADGFDGGIDTAPVVLDASLRAAPLEDGEILGAVQAGSTVILTGASVDGFVAASFDGTGGWLPATAIA